MGTLGCQPYSSVVSRNKWYWFITLMLLASGICLRLNLIGFRATSPGFDEVHHTQGVVVLAQKGLTGMPEITEKFIEDMQKPKIFYPHPLRFLYPEAGAFVYRVSGLDPYESLRVISALMSTLILLVGFYFTLRWLGKIEALSLAALMAFAPTQLYLAQYALADGLFAFWATVALGSLWESLQKPDHKIWAMILGIAVCCMILTKENAAFVCFFIVITLALAKPLKLGAVGRPALYAAFFGALIGGGLLVMLAGGFEKLFQVYSIMLEGVKKTPFVQYTNDGPWYRYLIDYLAVSPLILLLAVGFIFSGMMNCKKRQFLFLFVASTYLIMGNTFKDLRYTIMWDFPIRCLALGQINLIAGRFGSRSVLASIVLIFALICFDLNQFRIFFLDNQIYEPVSINLFRALHMIKFK